MQWRLLYDVTDVNVSVVNASYLGKNGAVTILFKILDLCQRKHLILLKHSLDTLGHLVKSSQYHAVSLSLFSQFATHCQLQMQCY